MSSMHPEKTQQSEAAPVRASLKRSVPTSLPPEEEATRRKKAPGPVIRGPASGQHIHAFTLPDATGQPVQLWQYLQPSNVLLVFHHGTNCAACEAFLQALAAQLEAYRQEEDEKKRRQERHQESTRIRVSSETWDLGEQAIRVTHLEKVYWPQAGFTKRDLLHYYQRIAPVMLLYLNNRPVTLRMFPQGVTGFSYYRRDCPHEAPLWLRRVSYQPKTVEHTIPLPLIDTMAGLLWFANQGAIEFHAWGSHLPDLNKPDLTIFDLDPGLAASFETVREGALRLHALFEQAGVESYPKTSGGRGLHVLVPLRTGPTFESIRGWVKGIGE